MDFLDRVLVCGDCGERFVFTAGEQLFFFDKQFKNDPKRCKPCKSKRSAALGRTTGTALMASGLTRTETRTECSACGVETTVPFKPTQGRPVLCRQCFQLRSPMVADSGMVANTQRTILQRAGITSGGIGTAPMERPIPNAPASVAQMSREKMQTATNELVAAAANDHTGVTQPDRATPTPPA
jgi:CxxC-x17-CxxC domain-containing protein